MNASESETEANRCAELIREADAVIWQADAWAARFSYVSEQAIPLLGYPLEEWKAEEGFFQKHVPAEDWPPLLAALYKAAIGEGSQSCAHRMRRADGSVLWAQTTVHRHDPNGAARNSHGAHGARDERTPLGQPAELRGATVDITPLKEGELRLRDSEAQYRVFLDNVRQCGLFTASRGGEVRTWPCGASRLFRYRSEEILGAPLTRLFLEKDVKNGLPSRLVEQAYASGQADYEGLLVRKGGETFAATLTLNTRTDGEHEGDLSIVALDRSARQRVEDDLRRTAQYFRLLVESPLDYAMIMLSIEGNVQSWNRGAQRLKGYRTKEILGAPMGTFFPPEENEKGTAAHLLETADRVGSAVYEGWLLRKGGTRFWGHLTLGAVEDEAGQLIGYSNIARDMSDRRDIEQALRQSEEHFRRLVESIHGYGMFMLSLSSTIESWNPGAQSLTQYRAPEIIGSPLSRFFPADEIERQTPQRLIEKARLEGSASHEGWLVQKGGATFWATLTLSTIEVEGGPLRGFSVVARDMTERKMAEEALREAEERTRLLIDSVKDYAVVMLSPEGRIERWSPAAERLSGVAADAAVGLPIARFFPEWTTCQRLLERAAAEGSAGYEGWLQRKGGGRFWAVCNMSAVTDSGGRLRGFSVVAEDITPRKRSERAQALLSDASAALAQSLESGEALERVAHLITRELAAWCVIHRLEADSLCPIAIAHADAEREQLARRVLKRIGREPKSPYGVAQVVHTGHSELYSVVSQAVWLADALGVEQDILHDLGISSHMCVPVTARGTTLGAITLVASSAHTRFEPDDLTVAEELARRVGFALDNAALHTQAQSAIRLREDILAIVSHDLRNPLNLVAIGAARLQRTHGRDEEAACKVVESIARASKRMDRMIHDLLDFSSIAAGRLTLRPSQQSANVLVESALEMMQPVAAGKCMLQAGNTARIDIAADRDRILQVFANLIGNAITFSAEGDVVTVGANDEPERVVFYVRDAGPGISAEQLPHIFDRYWHAKTMQRESFGLGLAIAKGIVEAQGGSIWVESTLGKGSTFFFTVPKRSSVPGSARG